MSQEVLFQNRHEPRILIVRLSAHGDTVQTMPLLNAIKAQWPDSHVGWLVERSAAPLLEGHPLIDKLHVCDRKAWLSHLVQPDAWFEILKDVWSLQASIRKQRYDLSLDVQGLFKSAVWPWLCGVPQRFGNEGAREKADFFYNFKLPPHVIEDTETAAITKYLSFVTAIGVPKELPQIQKTQFTIPHIPMDRWDKADQLLKDVPIGSRPVIALAPATVWPSKHWLEAHWYTLINELAQWDVSVLVLGSPGDVELINRVIPHPLPSNVYDLCGRTELIDLYAVFQRVNVLIGLDSAPVHIANAVASHTGSGPDIIALFGPTSGARTGPVGEKHRMLQTKLSCQPCFERRCPIMTHDCMKQLSPNLVLDTLKRMLAAQKLFQPVHSKPVIIPAPGNGF